MRASIQESLQEKTDGDFQKDGGKDEHELGDPQQFHAEDRTRRVQVIDMSSQSVRGCSQDQAHDHQDSDLRVRSSIDRLRLDVHLTHHGQDVEEVIPV